MAPLDVVELTKELVAIPSITNEEGPVCSFVADRLAERGWTVRTQAVPPDPGVDAAPGRMNVLATCADEPPGVVLTTHLDTVPPHIPLSEDDAHLFGRGTCDAKGIFAAQWVAAERLRAAGRSVALLGVVGEETHSLGAKCAAELLPAAGFIVDGEPTQGRMASGTKGILLLRLSVQGRAAHSAYPELGDSALHALVKSLHGLLTLDLPAEAAFGSTTLNVGTLAGGVAPNVVAPAATADVMIRLAAPSSTVEDIVQNALGGAVDVEVLSRSEPQAIGVVAGQPAEVVRFGSDVPYLSKIAPTLLVGPGSIHDAHTRHERIGKQELIDAVDQYVVVAEALLSRESER